LSSTLDNLIDCVTANAQLIDNCVIFRCAANCIPLLIQQKIDRSDFFNRSWAEFKVGFNDTRGNYWLGNDLLSQLTQNGRYKLRFDLQFQNLSWSYAEYSSFAVLNEANNYRLHVSGYSGNAGDALSYQDGMMFTTYDRDNDPWISTPNNDNCAVLFGGGFWYKNCAWCRVNGVRGQFEWYRPTSGWNDLHSTRMWLTC